MPTFFRSLITALILLGSVVLPSGSVHAWQAGDPQLEGQLRSLGTSGLAKMAAKSGDAARGAIVFHQAGMSCSKCHATSNSPKPLPGPSLLGNDAKLTDEAIVEAILDPSKTIRKGFETTRILTSSGEVIAGIVAKKDDKGIELRLADGTTKRIETDEIESQSVMPVSTMPAGQAIQLASVQQFLDLVRYLMEIRDGGLQRAAELQPPESLLAVQLPEYESHIDHRGLIQAWDKAALKRGEAIYRRVCANCHGTKDEAGSLPTSLRFATGKFKNGNDPYSMYRTITHGFGFMPPQTWMVPSQKYDVIHYIRETYLRPHNPSQLAEVNRQYLEKLPKGDTLGPAPSKIEAWSAMDYGFSLAHCYQVPGDKLNFAYKGIAIRLNPGAGGLSRGDQWQLFDTDTMRMAAGWHHPVDDASTSRFIDWRDIQLNGEHGIHPRVAGAIDFGNSIGPGWANPATNSTTDDARVVGRDNRRYGPLPRDWARYRGLYHFGNQVVLSYSVGKTDILECPTSVELWAAASDSAIAPKDKPAEKPAGKPASAEDKSSTVAPVSRPWIYRRAFQVGPRSSELRLQVMDVTDEMTKALQLEASVLTVGNLLLGTHATQATGLKWSLEAGKLQLKIPAGDEPLEFSLWIASSTTNSDAKKSSNELAQRINAAIQSSELDLKAMTRGGSRRWTLELTAPIQSTFAGNGLAVDCLIAPEANPWLALMRFTGLDFFSDGTMAVCTWDGDVWHVSTTDSQARWRRIATGLYQPLGLKILKDRIYVTCRDQLAALHDLNNDGEIDFYECINNDHQVTEHFHEFAMGLQTDAAGNFYYAKSGRHALAAIVPHHGTLLRVSPDGSRTDILATGFRAANGVCLNPDGSFLVTDQEGFWNPKNRINWVKVEEGAHPRFYGNMFGYHDVTDESDSAMEPPLCWITNKFDRSPGELMWIQDDKWRELDGSLINLSYGTGQIFSVLHEEVDGVHQGGMIAWPIPAFPTGVMRGRIHPQSHDLIVCGMFAWAGNATQPGGLYRIRKTSDASTLPAQLHASPGKLELGFTAPLDASSVSVDKLAIKSWSLKRTKDYGSKHYDEKELAIDKVELAEDRRTVIIHSAALAPTWCMEIQFDFRTIDQQPAVGVIHNTIHKLK